MSYAPLKTSEAAAKIQFAINLLHSEIMILLQKNLSVTERLDFNNCLRRVQAKIGKFVVDSDSQKELQKILERAIKTRNEYCHQKFDFNHFEHAAEGLLKLASLLGLSECREKIMEHIGHEKYSFSTEKWEKLKSQGNEHYKSARWKEAMDCYTEAIRINSKSAVLYSNRALCEIRLAKFDLAREDAEDAIDIDPKQVKFYRTLSEALQQLQLYQEALDACQDGLKIDPRDETLLLRARDCQALVVDKKIKENPVFGSHQMKNPESFKRTANHLLKLAVESDFSPEDLCPMDMLKVQTTLEINKAHRILLSGMGNVQEEQKALEIFESTARRGSAEGLFNMAVMYKDGMAGLTRDPKKYLDLCHQAAEQKPYLKSEAMGAVLPNIGVAEAENSIAMAYRDGFCIDQDDKLAFQWFLRSSRHGCASAMNNLGLALYNGAGCAKNLASARCWYQKSAEIGQSEAQYNLADMLLKGEGGPIDAVKASELLKDAAEQGLPGALAKLQQLMRSGAHGAKSMDESKKVVEEMANSNEKEALFIIGMNYVMGEGGFAKDLAMAEMYLRRASNLNHDRATFALGEVLLQQGKNEDAVNFFQKASESGIQDAQKTLGQLLALGHGCERDTAQARRWLLRSHESPAQVENIIEHSAKIAEFEAANDLSQSGLSVSERFDRFIYSSAPSGAEKEALIDLLKRFRKGLESPPHPACGPSFDFPNKIPPMAARAAQGSRTAQKFFIALNLLEQTRLELERKNNPKAFRLYRQAERTWQPLPVHAELWTELSAAAQEDLEKNPRHADALFVLAHYHAVTNLSTNAEVLRMALNCTNLDPSVADYHHFLGAMYGFTGDFIASFRSIELALELEWEPEWLYDKATSLRLQTGTDRQVVIKAYEDFISSNEPDNRHVPKAWYCIAMEYFMMDDLNKAKQFFEKGIHAESPEVRLPYFESIEDFPPKNYLRPMISIMASQLSMPASSGASIESDKIQCANCGKNEAPSRCITCKKAYYCGRDCRRKHWKVHKKNCYQ